MENKPRVHADKKCRQFQPCFKRGEILTLQAFDKQLLETWVSMVAVVVTLDLFICGIPPFDELQFLYFFQLLENDAGYIAHGAAIFDVFVPDVVLPVYAVSDIKRSENKSDKLHDWHAHQNNSESV